MLRVTKKIVIWICDSKNVRREEKMEKDFFRKDDYSEATLQNVRDLEEKFDGTLVSIPNVDGIYCYYNGLRFISIKAKSIEPFSKSESKDPQKSEYRNKRNAIRQEILAEKTIEGRIKKYKDNKTSIEWIMEHSMSQDAERYSQQVIVKRNMSFDDDDYSACGMETTIPSRYLSVKPNGKRKQAEVDIVIINPKQKKIYLVEYKCGKKTTFYNKQNIEAHCRDYGEILAKADELDFVSQMIKSCNVMRKIQNKQLLSLDDTDQYEINILFLLTKQPCDEVNKPIDNLTDEDVGKAKDLVKKTAQENKINETKIWFSYTEKPENVDFNEITSLEYRIDQWQE